ncbi:MAG: hypothetical protein MZV49_09930 [Rhodopseudomonas palustris]|nr:hypothetical protein [Rhodopseudomonas palustris]
MLRTHYRQPIDWTAHALQESLDNIASWNDAGDAAHGLSNDAGSYPPPDEVIAPLADDLNFSRAIAEMHPMGQGRARGATHLAAKKPAGAADFLGLQRSSWDQSLQEFLFKTAVDDEFRNKIDGMLEARAAARRQQELGGVRPHPR